MKRFKQYLKYGSVAVLSAVPAAAMANSGGSTFDAAAIGTQVASVIMGFVAMVSAVGMAAITVILAIQGFKMAWSMIKGVR
ncbi:hypothetical protein [Neisseria weaveri]|uniref:hypothetical protein n=1 Tax=Neisseria weaveri TaxID=28091 RepID=UPI0007C9BB94|nr:hypothetical protein [Neisseria weaveri]SAY50688.1 Uncharacterised protein [Neisseria weaveri]